MDATILIFAGIWLGYIFVIEVGSKQSLISVLTRTFSLWNWLSRVLFFYIYIYSTGANQVVDSTILKWNTKSRKFETVQQITTIGAYDWTYFSVRGYQFLAVAQAFNGLTTLMESVIYVYQKDTFVPFQTLEVSAMFSATEYSPLTL